MSDDQGNVLLPEENPFPPTSVAPVLEFGAATITIETPAIRSAITSLDAYLGTGDEDGGGSREHAGNVISVVGDYGSGKTHMAMYLLWHARHAAERTVYTMYVDAPADTFAALYRERFIPKLDPAEVYARVRAYYAEIVAASFDETGFAADIPRLLRDGKVDPRQVVWQMGMMESRFLQSLRQKLQHVTRNEAFGTALALLLRPDFESAVWEWFHGHPPDKVLQERGITKAIESDSDALEAVGVFAMLYGSDNHKFVLVIDELEKVLSTPNRPDSAAVLGFKKLLTVASESGAFLILSGLPEFLQSLGTDVVQRMGLVVRTTPLRTVDVIHYIENRMEQAFGERRLAPFSPDVVDYLTGLAGGNARRIMQLCHRAYQQATGKSAVTEAMIRDAARDQFELLTTDDLRAEIRRVLDTRGWPFAPNYVHGQVGKPRVDYWIPVGDSGAGCAVLLSDSVLYAEDVKSIADRVRAITAESPASRVLLVINGYLKPSLADALNEVLAGEPLVYEAMRFTDDFSAALVGMTRRLETSTHEDSLVVIRDRMERLSQMQAHTQDFVEQLAKYLDAMRASSDRQLGTIQRGLEGVTRLAIQGYRGEGQADALERRMVLQLPARVEQLFTHAMNNLAKLDDPNGLLRSVFTAERDSAGASKRRGLLQLLRSADAFQLVGLAALLHGLVDAFHTEIENWYVQAGQRPGKLTVADVDNLVSLCRTYDAIYEYLPLFRADDLAQLTARLPGRTDSIEYATRSSRRADIREALDGLGARVQDAMLKSLDTA